MNNEDYRITQKRDQIKSEIKSTLDGFVRRAEAQQRGKSGNAPEPQAVNEAFGEVVQFLFLEIGKLQTAQSRLVREAFDKGEEGKVCDDE